MYIRRRKTVAGVHSLHDVLIGPLPEWALSERKRLPHDDAEAPNVGRCREAPVKNRFKCRPSHRNLSSLNIHAIVIFYSNM